MVCAAEQAVCCVLFSQYSLELVLHVQGKEQTRIFFCCCSIRTYRFLTYSIYCFYQIAFADRQKNMVKLEGIGEKCTGLKKYDWYDNLKGETLTFVRLIMVPH